MDPLSVAIAILASIHQLEVFAQTAIRVSIKLVLGKAVVIFVRSANHQHMDPASAATAIRASIHQLEVFAQVAQLGNILVLVPEVAQTVQEASTLP